MFRTKRDSFIFQTRPWGPGCRRGQSPKPAKPTLVGGRVAALASRELLERCLCDSFLKGYCVRGNKRTGSRDWVSLWTWLRLGASLYDMLNPLPHLGKVSTVDCIRRQGNEETERSNDLLILGQHRTET